MGAKCRLREAGEAESPRKAFSFFESAVFCQNKGQERSCVLPRGLHAPKAGAHAMQLVFLSVPPLSIWPDGLRLHHPGKGT